MSVTTTATYKHIELVIEDSVATLTLNRPDYNVLNIEMMAEINTALESLNAGAELKALVIRAEGKVFSAGVDIAEHTEELAEEMIETFHKMFRLLDAFVAPTIALVHGAALGGGCELALFCDMVVASEKAKFGQPEIKVGVFPPIAALNMPKLMSLSGAYEFLLSGENWKADELYRRGVVNHVYPVDSFPQDSSAFVRSITSNSAIVLRLTKKALKTGLGREFETALPEVEDSYLQELMKTADAHEGLTAFMEKREPKWTNR